MFRKLALSTAAIVLALAAVEVFIRTVDLRVMSLHRGMQKLAALEVFDPERRLLTGPSDTDAIVLGHDTHFNSFGMRDAEPDTPKPPGRFRILVLGDSIVFGQGVAQQDMVAEVLRRHALDGGLDVVSAGIPGWRTVDEEQFLLKHIDRIDPDLVVLLYVENDNEPIDPFQRNLHAPRGIGPVLYRALLLHSRAFEWAVYVYRSRIAGAAQSVLDEAARFEALLAAQGPPFAPDDPGWIASRDAVARMHRLLESRGARLAVFFYDLGTVPPDALVRVRLSELKPGIALFETRSFFAEHSFQSLINAPGDPHPNKLGHELLGRGIARTLLQSGTVPASLLRSPADIPKSDARVE